MRKFVLSLLALAALLTAGCQQQSSTPITAPPGGGVGPSTMGYEQEAQAMKSILQNDPQNLNTLIRLGNLYMDNQRFNEAIENYQKALEIDPKNNNVRVDMGTCYRRTGRPDIAEKVFKEALAADPNHPFANMNLAVVLAYDLGRYEEAATYFEKYIQVDPASPNVPQIKAEIERLRMMTAEGETSQGQAK